VYAFVNFSDQESSTDAENEVGSPMLMDRITYYKDSEGNRVYNGVIISKVGK